MRGNVCEEAEEEFSLDARLKGGGYDDVAALRQVHPLEDGPGVDVDAPADLLLGHVHAVDPVQLHLSTGESPSIHGTGQTANKHNNDYSLNQERTQTDLMDVKPYGEVFSPPLSQRGSAISLLQGDQNLVLWFRHVKHELQPRKKRF